VSQLTVKEFVREVRAHGAENLRLQAAAGRRWFFGCSRQVGRGERVPYNAIEDTPELAMQRVLDALRRTVGRS